MEELFRAHWALIFNYFARRTRDRRTAEDLAGDVFLRAVRSFASWRGDNPAAWLLAISHNVLVDWARRKRLPTSPLLEAENRHAEDPAITDTDLRVALQGLSERDRRLLELLHIFGFTVHEVAAITGSSPASVRTAAYRARAAARVILKETK